MLKKIGLNYTSIYNNFLTNAFFFYERKGEE